MAHAEGSKTEIDWNRSEFSRFIGAEIFGFGVEPNNSIRYTIAGDVLSASITVSPHSRTALLQLHSSDHRAEDPLAKIGCVAVQRIQVIEFEDGEGTRTREIVVGPCCLRRDSTESFHAILRYEPTLMLTVYSSEEFEESLQEWPVRRVL